MLDPALSAVEISQSERTAPPGARFHPALHVLADALVLHHGLPDEGHALLAVLGAQLVGPEAGVDVLRASRPQRQVAAEAEARAVAREHRQPEAGEHEVEAHRVRPR